MRINQRTRYPHPVLCPDTTDFQSGHFEVTFSVEEDTASNQLKLDVRYELTSNVIAGLVEKGTAAIGVDVRCADTYYSRVHELVAGADGTRIEFNPGELSGRVALRPIVWTQGVGNYEGTEFNAEYSDSSFEIEEGTLLAWDIEQALYVGRKKLAPMDSIFSLAKSDDLKDGELSIDPSGEKIEILANERTFEHVHFMRQSRGTQAVILNSIYLPAVMQILGYIRSGDEFSETMWYQVFKAKCDHYELDLQSEDLMRNAQILLQMPYLRIEEAYDE